MSKKKLTILTILSAGAVIAGMFFLFFGWQEESKMYSVTQSPQQPPVMEVRGVKFTEWDKQGEKLWVLQADKATQFPQRIILKNAKVSLFEDGKPVSEGTAEQVMIKSSSSDLLLKGNIHIVSYQDKAKLTTSQLRWDGSEKKLYSEQEVTIKKGGLVIKGKGLIGKPDLSSIIIKNQVTTYIEGGIQ